MMLTGEPANANGNGNAPPALAKSRAGRRPGVVWEFFTPVRTETNKTHATCNFCERRCAGVASRMIVHVLKKCPAAPPHAVEMLAFAASQERQLQQDQRPEKRQRLLEAGESSMAPTTTAMNSAAALNALRSGLHERMATGAMNVVSLVQQKLVVACLRNGMPFEFLEDEYFNEALAALNAGFPRMSKELVTSKILSDVDATVTEETTHWLRASASVTLAYNQARHEWLAIDEKRRRFLLAESTAEDDQVDSALRYVVAQREVLSLPSYSGVFGICTDATGLLAALRSDPETPLLSTCMLRTTLDMWREILMASPIISKLLVDAASIAETNFTEHLDRFSPQQLERIEQFYKTDDKWCFLFSLVKLLWWLEDSLRVIPEGGDGLLATEFWVTLQRVDVLLAPFAWLFALSESREMASSQYVLLWVWVLASVPRANLYTTQQNTAVMDRLVKIIAHSIEDHHLVAFLLDPRIRGAGFSATGRRRVKSLVLQVAMRIWSARGGVDVTTAREALLVQLGHYVDRTGVFADDVVWEMSRGKHPEAFWKDYVEDAPELAHTAMTVLAFVPYTQSTSDYFAELEAATKGESQNATESFVVRRIKHHVSKSSSSLETTQTFTEYAQLLSPIAGTSIAGDGFKLASGEVKEGSRTPRDVVMKAKIELVTATTPQVDDKKEGASEENAVNASWFAFAESDKEELENAIKRLIPPSLVRTKTVML
ncbi:hypothetical protein Poli38472_007178 [Pythium oligandrum]|uniref:BED-type domain-containing protein n=1 Tax=Pythium oligandrum TaxID=41045 RepID=A0A8K1CAA4_PYTOL|nr:hypothetical protein Poli38472_007178 [Pythium oligandrum]|eukprot:TMW59033.1 hypothetical protein Poli38472_007178 [Pythium oligandrum]